MNDDDVHSLLERVSVHFDVPLASVSPVRGGQDSAAVVLRGTRANGTSVAIKLTRRARPIGLLVSSHLARHHVPGVPVPLHGSSGLPFLMADDVQASLQPWITGRRAVDGGMNAQQWRSFGSLLARIHDAKLPSDLQAQLPQEEYRPTAAATVRSLQPDVLDRPAATSDALTRSLVNEWRAAEARIAIVLDHIDALGNESRSLSAPEVLCHGDAHTVNVQLDVDGRLWLLDWDEVMRAPRERDLMFVIGGVIADAPVLEREQAWFFDGYGPVEIDQVLLAYYRGDWALQDIADFGRRVLDGHSSDEQRVEALRFFRSLMTPTGIVELALTSLRQLGRF